VSSVTVVIPCYNYGHYLEGAVASALEGQPGVDVRVLVVDDASPDGSGDIARSLAERHPRVEAIVHPDNRGHIATYNEGLSLVATDYVVLLSADDLLTRGSLVRAAAVLDANPSVGLVYGRPRSFWGDHVPRPTTLPAIAHVWRGSDWIRAQARRGQSCIYSPEAVVRTRIQNEVGGYNPALPHTGDLEMWLRVAAAADVAYVSGPDQAFRRMHTLSMMQTTYSDELVDIVHRNQAYESFFDTLPRGHPAHVHAAVARRRLAEEAMEDLSGLLLRNTNGAEDVDRYLALAAELDSEAARGAWQRREVEAWLAWRVGGHATSHVVANALTTRRRVEHRLRRYRWHWRGV
jgi:glycosyltransferase involved in cell wall biosynthesis